MMQTTELDKQSIAVPTRAQGLKRLAEFLPRAGKDYQATRNLDLGLGRHSNVSNLSPYIRHRLITEEEVLASVLNEHTEKTAFKFVQEVFWRSYWKGSLEHKGMLWSEYQHKLLWVLETLNKDHSHRRTYDKATAGETDILPFNEWVVELKTTGYLHNHARMWFASVWIFTFKLPWELGADFFLRHLLDGDPASNTLAWRWVAGLHTKDKTYLATATNIRNCSGARYTDSCDFSLGLKRLASCAKPQQENLSPSALQNTPIEWPKPMSCLTSEGENTVLLLTEEDLHTQLPTPVSAVAALTPTPRSPIERTSDGVTNFTQGAIEDALQQLGAETIIDVAPQAMGEDEIVTWAVERKVQQILHAYVPSGPTQLRLQSLAPKLAAKGIKLTAFMRDYDRLIWPHANKGFFQLGKQIPNFLAVMELGHKQGAERSLIGL